MFVCYEFDDEVRCALVLTFVVILFAALIAAKLQSEKDEGERSLYDVLVAAPSEAYDMIMDPNKKEREEEEKLRKEVKASKKQWRLIRKERFAFLDANGGASTMDPSTVGTEEKKVEQ